MFEEEDGIIKLPDSDPIPEILIVDLSSEPLNSHRSLSYEEDVNNEEDIDDEDETIHISSIPDSTPNLEDEILNKMPEQPKATNKSTPSKEKNRSNCCLLI